MGKEKRVPYMAASIIMTSAIIGSALLWNFFSNGSGDDQQLTPAEIEHFYAQPLLPDSDFPAVSGANTAGGASSPPGSVLLLLIEKWPEEQFESRSVQFENGVVGWEANYEIPLPHWSTHLGYAKEFRAKEWEVRDGSYHDRNGVLEVENAEFIVRIEQTAITSDRHKVIALVIPKQ